MTTTTQDTGTTTQAAGGEQGTTTAAAPNQGATGGTQAATGDNTTQQTTEQPAAKAEDKAGEQQQGDAAAIDYEFTAPDGIELDTASVDQFKAIAQELKLPKEAAEKIAGIAIQREVARREAFQQQVQNWHDATTADPELGKAENQATARKAIDTFGTPELKAMLNASGLGNHPEVVRMALKVGKLISEDTIEQTNRSATPATTREQRLYPTSA